MKVPGILQTWISRLVYLAVGALSLLVLAVSLMTTVVFRQYEQNDLFDFVPDNLPLLVLSMAAVLLVMAVLCHAGDRKERDGMPPAGAPFPWLMLSVAGAVSLFLVLVIRGLPTADASQLDTIIVSFMEGDYSALEEGGYLYIYPFQVTYVYLGELLAMLTGQGNYLVYQLLNVVSIEVNLYLLYRITWELFGSRRICLVMQLLSCGAFCYYAFSTFIYQDLWSFAVQTAALYLQLLYMKRGRVRYELGAAACITAAYLLKSNSLIALIAMVLLLIADAVWKGAGRQSVRKLTRALMLCVLLVALPFAAWTAVKAYTVWRTGINPMPDGVPFVTYLAMGMQTAEGKSGWYNGFNKNTYAEAGYDAELTKELSMEAIRESIGEFRNSGRYFVNFYYQKFISQWGDPTCVSMRELENTSRHTGELSALASSLIFGMGSRIMQWIMNVFHSMIYLGMTIYAGACLSGRRPDRKVRGAGRGSGRPDTEEAAGTGGDFTAQEVLLVVFIFGGMLFHELWEASGRYILRYYLTMLPLSSWGLCLLSDVLSGWRRRMAS